MQGKSLKENTQYLYRYQSLEGHRLLYIERTLLHNEIYFCSPSTINDPFDCFVNLDFEASVEDWRSYLYRWLKKVQPTLSEREQQHLVEGMIRSGRYRSIEFQYELTEDLQRSVNSAGLLCLTERNNCILMWSHYANAHTGICLQFIVNDLERYFAVAHKVIYLACSQKTHAIYDDPTMQVENILLSKARCWKYENEWRIIDFKEGYGVKQFPPSILTGIILGCKISERHQELLLRWVEVRSLPLDVYKAERSVDGFQIQIRKLDHSNGS
jgi:hypothetical protein